MAPISDGFRLHMRDKNGAKIAFRVEGGMGHVSVLFWGILGTPAARKSLSDLSGSHYPSHGGSASFTTKIALLWLQYRSLLGWMLVNVF